MPNWALPNRKAGRSPIQGLFKMNKFCLIPFSMLFLNPSSAEEVQLSAPSFVKTQETLSEIEMDLKFLQELQAEVASLLEAKSPVAQEVVPEKAQKAEEKQIVVQQQAAAKQEVAIEEPQATEPTEVVVQQQAAAKQEVAIEGLKRQSG